MTYTMTQMKRVLRGRVRITRDDGDSMTCVVDPSLYNRDGFLHYDHKRLIYNKARQRRDPFKQLEVILVLDDGSTKEDLEHFFIYLTR